MEIQALKAIYATDFTEQTREILQAWKASLFEQVYTLRLYDFSKTISILMTWTFPVNYPIEIPVIDAH